MLYEIGAEESMFSEEERQACPLHVNVLDRIRPKG
jgi:hypothetical protein